MGYPLQLLKSSLNEQQSGSVNGNYRQMQHHLLNRQHPRGGRDLLGTRFFLKKQRCFFRGRGMHPIAMWDAVGH